MSNEKDGMLYPSVIKLVEGKGRCRYSLVIAVAKKARMLSEEAEKNGEKLEEKPIKLAVKSFESGESEFHEAASEADV